MPRTSRQRFETFNDGLCSVYTIGESGEPELKLENLRFSYRVVGSNRHFAARQAQTEINEVIRIPQNRSITSNDEVIKGRCRYKIEQAQHINDTNPPVTDLTLRQLEMNLDGGSLE